MAPSSPSSSRACGEYSLRRISELKHGDHICAIYDTEEEHKTLVTEFLYGAIRHNEKVVYIADLNTKEKIISYFECPDAPFDIVSALARGQIQFFSHHETYTSTGSFQPGLMITLLELELQKALDEGFTGLRITGEMTWIFKSCTCYVHLIDYESRVNQAFENKRIIPICQYHRHKFSPKALLQIINTHPVAIVGLELFDNFYYIPPDDLLAEDTASVQLRHWLKNLAERKKVEEELIKARDEARRQMRTKTEFLSTMSHEIRTPLNGMIGMIQLLERSNLTDEQKEYLQTLDTCGTHLLSVVNDILDLSRVEAGKYKPVISTFSVFKTIADAIHVVKSKAAEKCISIKTDFHPNIALCKRGIISDEQALRKVLINLLGNSIKYSNNNSHITIMAKVDSFDTTTSPRTTTNDTNDTIGGGSSSSSTDNNNRNSIRLLFSVKDTGIGISPSMHQAIFESFTRVEDNECQSDQPEGTGLGLAIAKKLVNQLGGRIWVESEVGQGSTFYFTMSTTYIAEPIEDPMYITLCNNSTHAATPSTPTPTPACACEHNTHTHALAGHNHHHYQQQQQQEQEQFSNSTTTALQTATATETMTTTTTTKNNTTTTTTSISSINIAAAAATNNNNNNNNNRQQQQQDRSKVKILVVEDNSINVKVISRFLKDLGFTNFDVASNGQEAVDMVKKQAQLSAADPTTVPPYEIILMDVRMPVLSGTDASWQIRQMRDAIKQPAIVAVTASVLEEERQNCLKAGMDDFFVKPIRKNDLEEVLTKWTLATSNEVSPVSL